MTKKYLSQGVVLDTKGKDGVHNFDLENYVVSVLNKTETCCVRNIVANSLQVTAGITASTDPSMLAAFIPSDAIQDVAAGGGTINVTSYLTTINTDAGGDAFTIADGSTIGQLKKISLLVDGGGNATITGVHTVFNTITMQDAGDYVILQWATIGGVNLWTVIDNSGSTIA